MRPDAFDDVSGTPRPPRRPTVWDRALDRYLSGCDTMARELATVSRAAGRAARDSALVQPGSNLLLKLTIAALLVVFVCVLVSCQSAGARRAPKPRAFPARTSPKSPESLYVKRDTLSVRPRESGSHTGSIFADAQEPRQLFADARPSREGDMVTVLIPDDLQFVPPPPNTGNAASSPQGSAKGLSGKGDAKTAGSGQGGNAAAGGDPKALAAADATGAFTDPNQVGIAPELQAQPVKEFKMEIVGIEPGGDVYLRGTKTFQNSLGETRNLMVLAKMPKRALTSFDIDARALTQVAVNEDANGHASDYSTPGWDATVSRKLSGFVPDINAELAALEDVRSELGVAQAALKDQARAQVQERERLVKERQRLALQAERMAAAASSNGANGSGAAGAASATGANADATGAGAGRNAQATPALAGAGTNQNGENGENGSNRANGANMTGQDTANAARAAQANGPESNQAQGANR